MNSGSFIRASGWALTLGALIFSCGLFAQGIAPTLDLQLGALEPLGWWSIYIGLLLIAIGVLGLRARYGNEVGGLGKAALLVGAISAAIAATGGIDLFYEVFAEYWVVIWVGVFLLFACLLLFGIQAVRRQPFPRWNWLPLLAGAFPVALLVSIVITAGDVRSMEAWGSVAALISTLSLLPLGYLLQADTTGEPALA